MDLEQESTIAVDTGMSKDIADSCNKLIDTQKQLKAIDDKRKKLEEVERTLSEQTIPNLMQQAGISMLKLADGSSVEISKKYAARIPAAKSDEALSWLRENGFEDLIKKIGNKYYILENRKDNDHLIKNDDIPRLIEIPKDEIIKINREALSSA